MLRTKCYWQQKSLYLTTLILPLGSVLEFGKEKQIIKGEFEQQNIFKMIMLQLNI